MPGPPRPSTLSPASLVDPSGAQTYSSHSPWSHGLREELTNPVNPLGRTQDSRVGLARAHGWPQRGRWLEVGLEG